MVIDAEQELGGQGGSQAEARELGFISIFINRKLKTENRKLYTSALGPQFLPDHLANSFFQHLILILDI